MLNIIDPSGKIRDLLKVFAKLSVFLSSCPLGKIWVSSFHSTSEGIHSRWN